MGSAALQAYAVPLRMRLVAVMRREGAATVNRLAALTGRSVAEVGEGLAALAEHGFVRCTDRDVPLAGQTWEPTAGSVLFDPAELAKDPDNLSALAVITDQQLSWVADAARAWAATIGRQPEEWVRASAQSTWVMNLRVDELAEFMAEMHATAQRWQARSRGRQDAAAVPVAVQVVAVPQLISPDVAKEP
jgi:hypothetical protein